MCRNQGVNLKWAKGVSLKWREGVNLRGFSTERQRAVYDSMKIIFDDDAEDATKTLFDLIQGELNIIGWEDKSMVLKDIENKVIRFLKTKMDRTEAKVKAQELVSIIKRNKDA